MIKNKLYIYDEDMARKIAEELVFKLKPYSSIKDEFMNRLTKVVGERWSEQVFYAGFQIACKANGITQEHMQELCRPYLDGLNAANRRVWNLLWELANKHLIQKSPGTAPKAAFDMSKRCNSRCWNAKGFDCFCPCGSALHGQGEEAAKLFLNEAIPKSDSLA